MNKSFTLTCKQDVIDLIRNQEYQDSLWDTYDFTTYGSGHPQMPILSHDGYNIRDDDVEFKLYRRCSLKESMLHTDTSSYAKYSVMSLETAIGSVRASLERHYDALLDKADELQMELLYLMMLMRLRKRLECEEQFWDTIRHEYAHALVTLRDGKLHRHDGVWKSACCEVG